MEKGTYYIKCVEFNFREGYIEVDRNYGNRIDMPSIEIAREVYKAINDGRIEAEEGLSHATRPSSFKTINQIKDFIDMLEK